MERRANEIRQQNTTAIQAVANILKSSLGPSGLDKMIVDNVGDVTISNDGATILRQLDVQHPAAKVLCELSELQDKEVGDGTTSVVIYTAELLKNALELVQAHIHPNSVILGYKKALRWAQRYITEHLTFPVAQLGPDTLLNIARTTLSSKTVSADINYFSNLCVEAVRSVQTAKADAPGQFEYPIKAINILKAHGRSMNESVLVPGICLPMARAAQGMPRVVRPAKIALLDFGLQRMRMRMGIQVEVTDPMQLEAVREQEVAVVRKRLEMIFQTGCNVILCTGGIDDLCLKPFVEANAIGVRRVNKDTLRHIAKATGGQVLLNLSNLEGEETFDAACLGEAEEVSEERVADDDCIFIKGCKTTRACSLLLRGPNDYMLDEMERSLHDALCALKRTLESDEVVVGGGAVDGALNIALEKYATTLSSREQLAISAFARSLLVIPKTLAVNAALDATELVARLRAAHALSQQPDTKTPELKWSGLNLVTGDVINNLAAGVLEPAMTKQKALQFATDAAVAILRVDDHFKLEPEPQQQGGPQ
eukprot:GAFH01001226.1.p2 GENE.GAFH01001226.1~~GAFH01001226.1.p2  ORF type:complete len:539 (+),score=222.21 GAFH01001226.1:31-1647(+)